MAVDRRKYFEAFGSLRGIFLEDSWVLAVTPQAQGCRFRLDAVVTPDHPDYHAPRAGEQYCYELAVLDVTSASPVLFFPSGDQPATDATGEKDWGNIDSFTRALDEDPTGTTWRLEGSWGSLLIRDPIVLLTVG